MFLSYIHVFVKRFSNSQEGRIVFINKIIRSKRKTLALYVKEDGSLLVCSPRFLSDRFINEFVKQKKRWIEKKREQIKEREKFQVNKQFSEGEEFLFLGKSYVLRLVDQRTPKLILAEEFRLAKPCLPRAREIFITWYKRQAREFILQRVPALILLTGGSYKKIRITSARRRWGSCSSLGNLNFSWRLIMAPPEIIDYVIIHELVHLTEKNHAKQFWGRVEKAMPDYQERRNWLKTHGHLLII